MIKLTKKQLEEIMLKNFNKKTTYLGVLCDDRGKRFSPKKFALVEWDEEDRMKALAIIQEAHILKLINNK